MAKADRKTAEPEAPAPAPEAAAPESAPVRPTREPGLLERNAQLTAERQRAKRR